MKSYVAEDLLKARRKTALHLAIKSRPVSEQELQERALREWEEEEAHAEHQPTGFVASLAILLVGVGMVAGFLFFLSKLVARVAQL